MKIVRVKLDGSMDEISITKSKNITKNLESIAISKGNSQFKLLYEWSHDMKKLECYGWFDGEAGFENKHELIPNGNSSFLEEDSSEVLLFGDIFIISKTNDKCIDLDIATYGEIFSNLCDGFHDCNTSDDDESEEEDELSDTDDEKFIVSDNEEITTDESYSGEDDLDIDENSYTEDSEED
tara:strand:+ start:3327 stop:3869 length:543 start_codon:yes stop_codon:yes gene_type:complete